MFLLFSFLEAFNKFIKLSRSYFIELPWFKGENTVGYFFGTLNPLTKGFY